MFTPEQRILRASMGGLALVAQGKTNTAPARANSPGQLLYWERQVDPDRQLPEAERSKRAEAARKQYMTGLALKSSRVRAEEIGMKADERRPASAASVTKSPAELKSESTANLRMPVPASV